MSNVYDILILGGGPIAASTAYFLSQEGKNKVGILFENQIDNKRATYKYAGGCVRWFWDEPLKISMTKETADFVKKIADDGVDVSLREDTYLFLYRGVHTPAINVSAAKLVDYFIKEAAEKGVTVHGDEVIENITKEGELHTVSTDRGSYKAKKVLLALGAENARFMPDYDLEKEDRYLLVLDLPVGEAEIDFPHTIAKVGDGYAYVFVKKMSEGWRFLVSQEDVLPTPKEGEVEIHFEKLLSAGFGEVMPFLQKAKVERMLTGTDVETKELLIKEKEGLMAANCGSAVRSCVWIGRELTKRITA